MATPSICEFPKLVQSSAPVSHNKSTSLVRLPSPLRPKSERPSSPLTPKPLVRSSISGKRLREESLLKVVLEDDLYTKLQQLESSEKALKDKIFAIYKRNWPVSKDNSAESVDVFVIGDPSGMEIDISFLEERPEQESQPVEIFKDGLSEPNPSSVEILGALPLLSDV